MLILAKSLIYLNIITISGVLIFFLCAKQSISRRLCVKCITVLLYSNTIVFASPNILVNQILSLLIVPLFARRREHILPVYILAFLVMPVISYPIVASGTYLFVFTNFMGLSIGAYATSLAKGGVARGRWTTPAACLIMIFAVYFISGARGGSVTNIIRVFVELTFMILLPYNVVKKSIRSMNDVREILIILAVSCTMLSVLACYEATKTWPIYRIIYDHYGIIIGNEVQVKMRGSLMRASGPFLESTSFAIWLSFGAFVGLTGRWIFKSKIHHGAICGILLIGLFAPQSRGAWLGLAIALVLFQIGKGKIGAVVGSLFGAATFGAVGYGMARVIPQLGAMLGLDQSGTIGRDYRQDLLTRGMEEAQKSLIFGADITTVLDRLGDMRQGEGIIDFVNTYLYVLLVSGLIGLFAFTIGMFVPVIVMWKRAARFRQLDYQPMSVIAALLGSLMVMLVFTSLTGRTTMGVGMLFGAAAALAGMKAPQMGAASNGSWNAAKFANSNSIQQLLALARPGGS